MLAYGIAIFSLLLLFGDFVITRETRGTIDDEISTLPWGEHGSIWLIFCLSSVVTFRVEDGLARTFIVFSGYSGPCWIVVWSDFFLFFLCILSYLRCKFGLITMTYEFVLAREEMGSCCGESRLLAYLVVCVWLRLVLSGGFARYAFLILSGFLSVVQVLV